MRLRSRSLLAACAAVVLLAAGGSATASAAAPAKDKGPTYYVSLGDSLAQGYMPGQGDTDQGYTDRLYTQLKAKDPKLQHIKLGCSGATTTSMMNKDRCDYPGAKSQLDAAVKFIREHKAQVRYVTVDIGANDVARCAPGGKLDLKCTVDGIATVGRNLPVILGQLKAAGGSKPQYAGMTYYNPFLAAWLLGAEGQETARMANFMQGVFNQVIWWNLTVKGWRTADVATAFSTNSFDPKVPLPGVGEVPLNVARICQWTFMCTKQDIHANPTGYQVLADTFAKTLN